ncbi:hypothetical protein, partial [Ruthenibacterium lactatiformans]|uniref:hypothetical protein n=1 Tax=Ruthenibacterium lactatiformans TaxID=1550024 RepID=UPI002674E38F
RMFHVEHPPGVFIWIVPCGTNVLQEKENAYVPRGTFCGKGLLKPPKLCYTKTQRCKQKKLPLKS